MAISAGDWASATDPFILALAHAYTGTLGDLGNNRIIVYNSEGFLAAIVDDRDIQELFWSKDLDKEITWFVNAMEKLGSNADQVAETGKYQERFGSTFELFFPNEIFIDDTQDIRVYTTGKTGGAVLYSLFAYTAYSWVKKDPAQILFSWIAHHVNSQFTLKEFVNQASFQDASDYYDENPINLSLYREVGSTIAQQIKKVIEHTSDFLSIRPADSDGKMQLHITPRQSGIVSRTTAIDLDSKSIESYVVRPTDRYTLDRLDVSYGGMFFKKSGGIPDDPTDYDTSQNYDIPGTNRTKLSQKVGAVADDRNASFDAPYHGTRGAIANHLDIGQWTLDQDEVEIDFADWSHMNFEDGDLVPITGGKANYSGEMFLVTEKIRDLDTMLASARFLKLRLAAGKRPAYADNANLLLSFAPNSLGDYFDHNAAFPRDLFLENDPRNLDRIWDLSNNYAHVTEFTRGLGANPLTVDPDVRNRWPGIISAAGSGGDFPYSLNDFAGVDSGAATDITAYFVINQDAAHLSQTNMLFEQNGSAYDLKIANVGQTKPDRVQFDSGSGWVGTQSAIGGWQILVFVLKAAGASIRRNGADLETGLSYSQVRLVSPVNPGNTQSFLVGDGATLPFVGEFMEFHLFKAGHDAATISSIEEYLADKYSITI